MGKRNKIEKIKLLFSGLAKFPSLSYLKPITKIYEQTKLYLLSLIRLEIALSAGTRLSVVVKKDVQSLHSAAGEGAGASARY